MKVNGWRFEQSTLESGDVIEIGGLRLTFLDELVPQASRPARATESAPADVPVS
jgi:hypothetical protein